MNGLRARGLGLEGLDDGGDLGGAAEEHGPRGWSRRCRRSAGCAPCTARACPTRAARRPRSWGSTRPRPCGRLPSRAARGRRARRRGRATSWNAAYTGTVRYDTIARLPTACTRPASSEGSTKMRAAISLPAPTWGATVFTSSAESQLTIAPSPSRPAQAQHPLAQRGDEDGRLLGNGDPEPEAAHRERLVCLVTFSPVERGAQEPDRVADTLVRLVELHAVPPLDDHVRRRAEAEREPPGRGLAHRRDRRGECVRARACTRARSRYRGAAPAPTAAATASGMNAS